MRIGVFGGSFDPVHVGHLLVAEHAADALALDRVRLVLAGQQPFKIGRHEAPVEDRAAMLRLAAAGHPRLVVDLRETERTGPSYTVDTLRELHAEHPDDQLFLLVGADASRDLPQWREAEALPALATVVVLTRPGAEALRSLLIARTLQVPAVDISATQVRDAVRRGTPVAGLVPAPVAGYLASHGLYRAEGAC